MKEVRRRGGEERKKGGERGEGERVRERGRNRGGDRVRECSVFYTDALPSEQLSLLDLITHISTCSMSCIIQTCRFM